MQKKVRRQLTLFVNPNDAINIEKIRRMYNPVQFDLVKAHVTLCREDEIIDQDRVLANLYNISKKSFTVNFGKVVRFEEGKGVLFPALKDNVEFYGLRARGGDELCQRQPQRTIAFEFGVHIPDKPFF